MVVWRKRASDLVRCSTFPRSGKLINSGCLLTSLAQSSNVVRFNACSSRAKTAKLRIPMKQPQHKTCVLAIQHIEGCCQFIPTVSRTLSADQCWSGLDTPRTWFAVPTTGLSGASSQSRPECAATEQGSIVSVIPTRIQR